MNEEQEKAGGKTDYRKIVKSYGADGQMIVIGPTVEKRKNIDPIKDLIGVLNDEANDDE